ncbi:MAG: uracil-DNA glycosylase [Thermoleophilia bacterium]|nr:uracil-DNA glycosylase [Thermoleophilia bacterium]
MADRPAHGAPVRTQSARTSRTSTSTRRRLRASELASLIEVEAHASACTLCRLCRDRTQVVTGSGPTNADVLIVTEAPGYHEDRAGEHLVGRTGELFDHLLALAGLRRQQVFVTSVVKCRPSTGRTPFPDEVEACEGWLFREISLVRPRVIVTLGALALRLVTGKGERLADVHGTLLNAQVRGRDVLVWPLMHPAAAVHSARLKTQLQADARGLGALLAGTRSVVAEAAAAAARPGSGQHAFDPITGEVLEPVLEPVRAAGDLDHPPVAGHSPATAPAHSSPEAADGDSQLSMFDA